MHHIFAQSASTQRHNQHTEGKQGTAQRVHREAVSQLVLQDVAGGMLLDGTHLAQRVRFGPTWLSVVLVSLLLAAHGSLLAVLSPWRLGVLVESVL